MDNGQYNAFVPPHRGDLQIFGAARTVFVTSQLQPASVMLSPPLPPAPEGVPSPSVAAMFARELIVLIGFMLLTSDHPLL